MKTRTTLFILFLVFTSISITAQVKDSIYKVTDNVYVITGYTCNISFLVTDDGVILFDSGNQPDSGKRIMSLIRTVTDKPLKYIVITHYHWDHVSGLASLPSNVPIIAQINEKKNLVNREKNTKQEYEIVSHEADSLSKVLNKLSMTKGAEYSKIDSIYGLKLKKAEELMKTKIVYASELVDSMRLFIVGKDILELFYPGKAHTDGDLVINIKTKDVIVMGDLLFTKSNPYIDPLGNVRNWAIQLNKLADRNIKYYIPGHQQVATSDDLRLLASYLNDLLNKIGQLKKEGKTLDEIKKSISLEAYNNFQFQFFREQNIEAVYNQIK